ncbi:MAG: glycine oxidase ThiO [Proteobacteria bacterium]|nr:glycine oxidase ThiO [Pseudomonadota bacterium]
MTETSETSTSPGTRPGGARPSVAIIGAGVCGLGIGWRLAQAGCPVDVFDKGEAGRGATWASAGMLAGGVETEPGEEHLLPLAQRSQEMWPEFARELEAATGIDLGYRDEGILWIALTQDDAAQLRFTYEFQTGLGIALEWLTGAEARAREPHLKPGLAAAVYSRHDHQVDNRQLARALKQAFPGAGGRLHEHQPVTAVEIEAGRACGVALGDRFHQAEVVVLAAGAWSRDIPGLPEAARPPVRPLKGQALALRMDPAAPLIRHVVWVPKGYLVPRNDGRLLVGATVEERGFDESLTAGGIFALLETAWRALPAVEDLAIDELWVGFRPGSRDDAPILGATPIEGLVLATGHHRNGILLAPVTAEALARLVLTGQPLAGTEPFGIERFARGAAAA